MKTLLTTLAVAALLAPAAHAQKLAAAKVPAAAAAAFRQHFPGVKSVKWEKEGADYEAEFVQGKAEMSAVITAAGVLKETETEMPVAQLPAPVQKALATYYKAAKVTEAAKIVTAATGATTYEAEISQAGQHRDVLFRADGTEVKP
ncbi:PepSY-like domain-containing protein [Hymenobacter sp. DH14]|uniref:PepSY-like domain-containing protein n=1 Tax=Hymenobacter cyanobacteriorum TaxID=2926463 RepID=A0A9X1VEJ5_9BACT|nr:PepSY-like domain-containing protein [Hymenobacter cyanobacteriorum]MCI1187153.1 PepSY-like domain-containing protein [Hymenobacter cyanobacteriorum]